MKKYQETVEWMFRQLPMYQQLGQKAYKIDLSNIRKLSARLGDPHRKFKAIHVAGTNGKGSVSHMLASILQESGYKVGLYTSPHLKDFRERIKINGKDIPQQAVIDFVSANKEFFDNEHLSFFEMTVGLAFAYFSEEKVDIAIVEVGLGGRLDSTNIIHPELSVITNIGLDHTQILGNSLAEIAGEKAGIIKKNTPVVIGEAVPETEKVFREIASKLKAPIYFAEERASKRYNSDLKGVYQQKNINTVLAAIELLNSLNWNVSEETLRAGLENVVKNTSLRGRWEVLGENPKIICDTAHNAEGLTYAVRQLEEETAMRIHLVFGVVNDKDLSSVLPILPKAAVFYFCRPNIPRGMEAELLREKAQQYGLEGESFSSVSEAYSVAVKRATARDVVYVGGSTFTVAEII